MRTFPQFTRSTPRSTLSGAFAGVGEGGHFMVRGKFFMDNFPLEKLSSKANVWGELIFRAII